MPHIFANMQHCWQHYITHPHHQQSSQFQLLYLNTNKYTGSTLKLLDFI